MQLHSERPFRRLRLLNDPTGIDNVLRIYRSNPLPPVRLGALYAMARADAPETIAPLLEALDAENAELRTEVIGVTQEAARAHFLEAARGVHAKGSERLRTAIAEVFSSRKLAL